MYSVLAFRRPVGRIGGEKLTGVVIDIQSAQGAPCGERIRAKFDANGGAPFTADERERFMCSLLPLAKCEGQAVSILHDGENSRIVAAPIPRNADRADIAEHAQCESPPRSRRRQG